MVEKSRKELELGVAKKLDLNVENICQAELSEIRLTQIFDQATKASRIAKTIAGVWFGVLAGSIGAIAVGISMDKGGLAIAGFFGLMAVFSTSISYSNGNLKGEVQNEIDENLKNKVESVPSSP